MTEPLVDITIAVHTASRPIARAVASVVDHTRADVRVNVVAHNIDESIIRHNLGAYANHARVRVLQLNDGIGSPAGPMNYGLSNSTAAFVSIIGSDDELAPGAIDAWLDIQRKTQADVVLARIQLVGGTTDPYPPVRLFRRRKLDGQRDRLAYRSAPLGLISRLQFGDLRLTEGLASGEDLAYSLSLWFTGRNISYALNAPPYIGHDDSNDRVTSTPRPIESDFAFLDTLTGLPWFQGASREERQAIVVKIIRLHYFDAIHARVHSQSELDKNRPIFLKTFARLQEISPEALPLLSRADHAVFSTLRDPNSTVAEVSLRLRKRLQYTSLGAIITQSPLRMLHRQAPFRTLLAGITIAKMTPPYVPEALQDVTR